MAQIIKSFGMDIKKFFTAMGSSDSFRATGDCSIRAKA